MSDPWLLCDFHIHTRFSDGSVELPDVVDLFGRAGFDAIGISDHILDEKSIARCRRTGSPTGSVDEKDFAAYLQALARQARRAWDQYGMLLIPGIEVTNNTDDYHILAIDIKEYISPGQPVEAIVDQIHRQGGLAVAPHPHRGAMRGTGEFMHLWNNRARYAPLFDAWEIANRDDLFHVVGLERFNHIANSDFHEPHHLYSWKTLLHCDKSTEAVKNAIRGNRGVAIHQFRPEPPESANAQATRHF